MQVSLADLSDFAKRFVAELPATPGVGAHVVGLKGDLGAGKTTFVQMVAKELGVTATVTSPTFVFVQVYGIDHGPFRRLVHIDAYRLSKDDPDTIGWREYRADPANLILVEWPEHLPGLTASAGDFGATFPIIEFKVIDDASRDVVHYAP
jgi:tRNA threonylcarbamoyl adenosine modification protein YjeE